MLLDVAYHYPRGRILNFWIFVEQTNDSEPAVVQNGDTSISSLQSGNKGLPVQSPAFAQCDTSRSPCPDRPPPPPPNAEVGVVVAAAAHPRPCWLVGPALDRLDRF